MTYCEDFNCSKAFSCSKFRDKYDNDIFENDLLEFDNGSIYQVVLFKNDYCIKCLTADMPLLKLDKVCLSNKLYSAVKLDKVSIHD